MILRVLFLVMMALFFCTSAGAQKIIGLSKMDTSYIHLFTQHESNVSLSKEELEYDLQKIRNIPGVGQANIEFDENNEAYFMVKEVNTLLPIVNFGGIRDNFWFKLGISDVNLFGQGKAFFGHYQSNDGRHSGQIYFKDPYLLGTNWGYSVDLNRWASIEPLFFNEGPVTYDFEYLSVAASVIRNFGIQRSIEVGGNYFIESYNKGSEQVLAIPPGPQSLRQPKFLLNSSYQENLVNYNFFILDGTAWKVTIQNVYNIDDKNWFNIAQFQLSKYFKIKDQGNLAMRLRLAFSTNNYSPFAPFVADSQVNLRGVGNRIDRGTGQAVLNLEYRQTLLNNYPFGVQFVVFSDLGTWRNPGGELSELVSKESIRHFVGGGLRLIYQQVFGVTFRIDYGIDIFNPQQRGLVIGLGQYF